MTLWQQGLFGLLCASIGPIIAAFLKARGSLRAADLKRISDQRNADITAAGQLRDDQRKEILRKDRELGALRKERDDAEQKSDALADQVRRLESEVRDIARIRADLVAANNTIDLMKRQSLQG